MNSKSKKDISTIHARMNSRAEQSEKDVSKGRIRSYYDFQNEVKRWISLEK